LYFLLYPFVLSNGNEKMRCNTQLNLCFLAALIAEIKARSADDDVCEKEEKESPDDVKSMSMANYDNRTTGSDRRGSLRVNQ
jgi:hypothetical protein